MWLALDTATDRCSLAIGRGPQVLGEAEVTGARRHAGALLPLLDRLLREQGTGPQAIQAIALADGPGSFTGLRVGAAVAKAIVHVTGAELWSAPSLLSMAAAHGLDEITSVGREIVAVTDALRGEVYAACYRFRAGRIEPVLEPGVVKRDELQARVGAPALVVGVGPEPLGEAIRGWAPRLCWNEPAAWPRAATLLRLRDHPGSLMRIADPATWEPAYGRPAEAQVQWERAHGRPLPDSPGAYR